MELSDMDIIACRTEEAAGKAAQLHETQSDPLNLEVVGSSHAIFIQKEKMPINSELYNESYRVDKLLDGESSEHSQQVNLSEADNDTDQLQQTSIYN